MPDAMRVAAYSEMVRALRGACSLAEEAVSRVHASAVGFGQLETLQPTGLSLASNGQENYIWTFPDCRKDTWERHGIPPGVWELNQETVPRGGCPSSTSSRLQSSSADRWDRGDSF